MVKISRKTKKGALVTFHLDALCKKASLKGEWNNWEEIKMKRKKDGSFYLKTAVPFGRWEFGYICDNQWITEETLPKSPSPFGSENSIIEIKEF